jgi:hypothetical protein
VKEPNFTQSLSECRKSLDLLIAESQQTLSLAHLVKKFPRDVDRKTALQLQSLREDRLRQGYLSRRQELLRLVFPTKDQSDTAA